MSTLAELQQHRADAGAAYVDAVAALKTAYVNLAAIDLALENSKLLGLTQPSFHRDFTLLCDGARFLQHRQYAPTITPTWHSEAIAAAASIIAAYPTPD